MARTATPTGTLIQKAHSQPSESWSVKKPPTSGPTMAERPNRAPIGPMYLARSRAGTMSAMIAWARIIRPPPPRPCTPRQKTSQPKSGDSARSEEHTSELQSRQYLVCRLLLEKKNYILLSSAGHFLHCSYFHFFHSR